ncbi:MAG: UPF0175 family protein [Candidatus Hydrothermarchaeota archaeon]
MAIVSVRLEEEMLKDIELLMKEYQIDKSEMIRRLLEKALKEAKLEKALELLRKHKISVGKAAKLADVTIYEILDHCKKHEIHIGYSLEDLKRDLERFPI